MDSLIVSQCYKNPTKKSDSATEKNFKATCKFCPSRVISGNINNSSNFLKHIEEQHSIEFKKFQLVKQQVGPRKRKNDVPVEAADTRAEWERVHEGPAFDYSNESGGEVD